MTSNANSRQVAGTHYKTGYQHWDFVWDMGLGYFPGQVTKYLSRYRKKNGMQDLEKALHFAHKYKELVSRNGSPRQEPRKMLNAWEAPLPALYLREQGITDADESEVVWAMSYGSHNYALVARVVQCIERIMEKYKREESLAAEPGPGYTNQS